MLLLLQQPIIVELSKQSEPTRDVSIDAVLGMFAVTGLMLLAVALGSLIVAGAVVLYKRWRGGPAQAFSSHTRLEI